MAVVNWPSLEISSRRVTKRRIHTITITIGLHRESVTTRSHSPRRRIHLLPFAPKRQPRDIQQGRHTGT